MHIRQKESLSRQRYGIFLRRVSHHWEQHNSTGALYHPRVFSTPRFEDLQRCTKGHHRHKLPYLSVVWCSRRWLEYLTEWRDEKSCLQQNSFFEYAAQNWGYHIQNIQQDIADLALKLLMDDRKVSASSRIFRVPAQFCGMHLVAYFDLNDIAVRLLQKKDPDTKDSFPLSYAAEQGNARLVELLLSYNVDINTKCNREWTLLSRL